MGPKAQTRAEPAACAYRRVELLKWCSCITDQLVRAVSNGLQLLRRQLHARRIERVQLGSERRADFERREFFPERDVALEDLFIFPVGRRTLDG